MPPHGCHRITAPAACRYLVSRHADTTPVLPGLPPWMPIGVVCACRQVGPVVSGPMYSFGHLSGNGGTSSADVNFIPIATGCPRRLQLLSRPSCGSPDCLRSASAGEHLQSAPDTHRAYRGRLCPTTMSRSAAIPLRTRRAELKSSHPTALQISDALCTASGIVNGKVSTSVRAPFSLMR